MTEQPAALRFENLTLGYNRHPAVHHLQTQITQGSLTAIVGPNGAGKSTLVKGILGTLRPMEGAIHLAPGHTRADIAYLPQQSSLDTSFPLSVFDMVTMGLWQQIGAFRAVNRPQTIRIEETLETVGLAGYGGTPVGALSGGQLQRALFARVMVQDAPLVILDEPFNAIDTRTTEDLLSLIEHWHVEGRTVVAVLHDLEQVERHFPSTLLLARELIAQGPTPVVLTPENLRRARSACEAFDDHAPLCDRADDPLSPPEAAQ